MSSYRLIQRCIDDYKDNFNETINCIDEKFNFQQLIQSPNSSHEARWTTSFNNWFMGKTFTMTDYQMPRSTYFNITLTPQPDFHYQLEIYDPNFYFPTEKELTIPSAKVNLEAEDGKGVWANINTVYMEYLDRTREQGPNCVGSQDYSFTSCVEVTLPSYIQSLMLIISRSPWPQRSAVELRGRSLQLSRSAAPLKYRLDNECLDISYTSSFQQLEDLHLLYYDLSCYDIEDLSQVTGCSPPCSFAEYSFPTTPVSSEDEDNFFGTDGVSFNFILARTRVLKKTELLIQSWASFVAEIGGTLGLFVGFSFMMFWDLGEFTLNVLLKKLTPN